MKICPRCDVKKLCKLSTGQKRCSKCGLTREFDKTLWQLTQISPYWKGRLVEFFCLGVPAYRLRFQVPLNPKTAQRWFRILRKAIYDQKMKELSTLSGEIEMDETMFGGRVPGKRDWGAAGKHMIFGIYQINGKILTFPINSRGKDGTAIENMTHYIVRTSFSYTSHIPKEVLIKPPCPTGAPRSMKIT